MCLKTYHIIEWYLRLRFGVNYASMKSTIVMCVSDFELKRKVKSLTAKYVNIRTMLCYHVEVELREACWMRGKAIRSCHDVHKSNHNVFMVC